MVQIRAAFQIKACKIGFRVPCSWVGPMPNWFNPQQKLDFMAEMSPLILEWVELMGAYQSSYR